MRTYSGPIRQLQPHEIFVFGSNTQGRHGLGAAAFARIMCGAIHGKPTGLQGNSYAIVTKNLTKSVHPSVPRVYIEDQIKQLYRFAALYNQHDYLIAYNGLGKNLNGYSNEEMAEMFGISDIPDNIVFEEEFAKMITKYQHG